MNIDLSETELRMIYVALLTSDTIILSKKRTKAITERIKIAVREAAIQNKMKGSNK